MHRKRIALEHLHNMRDLGGCPTSDGRTTKWNLLYRCDAPSSLTADEWNDLKDLDVTLLIDLRSSQERKITPVAPGYPVEYRAASLMKELDEVEEEAEAAEAEGQDFAQAIRKFLENMDLNYTEMLFGNLPCSVEILDLILDNLKTGGATLFFCSAGKDRTGITAALVLYLCDVPREDIIADYMVSSTYNEKGINRLLDSVPAELAAVLPDKETLRKDLDSAPATMADLLEAFESRDIRKALAENGFGPQKQEELKDLMTEA